MTHKIFNYKLIANANINTLNNYDFLNSIDHKLQIFNFFIRISKKIK